MPLLVLKYPLYLAVCLCHASAVCRRTLACLGTRIFRHRVACQLPLGASVFSPSSTPTPALWERLIGLRLSALSTLIVYGG